MNTKTLPLLLLAITLAACALRPSWQWTKPGADEQDLEFDQNQCKARVYSGNAGVVTNETVRRMFDCMEARGWRKTERR